MEAKQIQLTPTYTTPEEFISRVMELLIEKPIGSKEAADYLGVNQQTLYRHITKGWIPAKCVHKQHDGNYMFFKSELRDYIKSL